MNQRTSPSEPPLRLTADLRLWRNSGIGRYLRNLLPLLVPQLRCQRIRVLGRREHLGEESWLSDSRVEFVEESAAIYSIAEQTIPLRHRFSKADLLWVPHYNVPLLYRGALIVTMHDIAPLAMPQILGSPLKRRYARLLIERAAAQASTLLCDSDFTRTELQRYTAAPREKLHLVYLGLEANWPKHAVPHREADGVPYVLFVGNVKPNKNLGLLLAAFEKVALRVGFRLLLVGKAIGLGTGDAAVLQKAQALGDRVRFTGEVSDENLQSLYAGALAFCMPSKYEGFGLPLLEAMALGCPVLSSSAASLPEVGGAAVSYFNETSEAELAACLLRTSDATYLEDLRTRGRERVEQFSFTRCAAETAEAMNELLERRD